MRILWQFEKVYVKDIEDKISDPKPTYNTVSTIVRILESKGFVSHTVKGKSLEYCHLMAKTDYTRTYFKSFLKNYYGNSFHKMASF